MFYDEQKKNSEKKWNEKVSYPKRSTQEAGT
jgi:hypothetical protein